MESTSPSTLQDALSYAKAGWQVFPCHTCIDDKCSCGELACDSEAKHPRTAHGLKDATADEYQVRNLFAKPANIGIRTGGVSRLVVVDIDPRHGGDCTIASLESDGGELPSTVEAITGGGGRHLYFHYPTDATVGSKNGRWPGVDIKADGGYVIGPSSIHISGKRYEWRPGHGPGETELAELPAWLLTLLNAKGEGRRLAEPGASACENISLRERAQQYVARAESVLEGARDDTAFRLAGHVAALMTDSGERLSEEEIVNALGPWNLGNQPPLSDRQLRKCISSALQNGTPRATKKASASPTKKSGGTKANAKNDTPSQSTLLMQFVADVDLFHDEDREAYARFEVGDGATMHWEIYQVRSRQFRGWLAQRFYLETGRTPSAQSMHDALGVIEAKAIFSSDERDVFTRVAETDGRTYLDLGNDSWQVVEIDDMGWRIVDKSPVMFQRSKAMQALATPDLVGNIQAFRRFANVTDEDWPLLLAYLVGAMCPHGPYPVLAVYGEHGSAKSTLCRFIRRIIDPNRSPLRADHRSPHDLMICASNNWIVALDNLSTILPWLSDCLCRLATGGGFSTRMLYENGEEMIFDCKRPVILNCIEEAVVRSDLLDRCIVLNLPRIDKTSRVSEMQLEREFGMELPQILGGLLTAVSEAIRNKHIAKPPCLPRMADFALRVIAAENALGLAPGSFLAAYDKNREVGNETAIDASPIGKALIQLVANDVHWSGTATELLAELESQVDAKTKGLKCWPATARVLSGTLKRLAPNLREAGIGVEFVRKGKAGARTITLSQQTEQSGNPTSVVSAPSATSEIAGYDTNSAAANAGAETNALATLSAGNETTSEKNGQPDAADVADTRIPACSSCREWGEL